MNDTVWLMAKGSRLPEVARNGSSSPRLATSAFGRKADVCTAAMRNPELLVVALR